MSYTNELIAHRFSIYNWYRLVIGIGFESGCLESATSIKIKISSNSSEELIEGCDIPTVGNSTWDLGNKTKN